MAFTDAQVANFHAAAATQGAAEDLYRLGLIYSTGQGAPVDLVQAHMWFNLAALRGLPVAKESRRELADQMTEQQVAAALKAAREWMSLRQ
jgi:uncharacterized protein